MCGGVLPPSTHKRTHSDCVSLSGPDGPTRSVKHPSDLCVKSVTRGHLFWTQRLAAPSQHNSSNGYVGDRGGWWGTAEKEEAAAVTGQFEMIKKNLWTEVPGGSTGASKPQKKRKVQQRICLPPGETSQHHLRVLRWSCNPAHWSRDLLIWNHLIILPLSSPETAGHLDPLTGWDASPFLADTW